MPSDFALDASPSLNPLYIISQSFLYGTNMKLDVDMNVENVCDKVWKFPTYVGMKAGMCSINGTFSWSDDDGEHIIPLNGLGVSWSMRALL